uniref:Uncharacterized protein n=1 Tax=Leersia perrieri TaxID=77586 RepID=A0A0D9WQ82_9ORYZ
MALKAEVRALTAAVEGANAVTLAAPAPIPPPPSPPCPPRRSIADTVARAMRSSPPVFVLASPASTRSSSKLRPPVHVAGERFTLAHVVALACSTGAGWNLRPQQRQQQQDRRWRRRQRLRQRTSPSWMAS